MRINTGACLFTIVLTIAGCSTPPPRDVPPAPLREAGAAPALVLRNNAYSLLDQLMNEQKDLSKLRFIKPENTNVKNLTKKISAASKAAAQMLEGFARVDPGIALKETDLPPGEVAVRNSIAKTKEHDLLTGRGASFELSLLLTQTEALGYAWHLAGVAARHDTNPDRIRALNDLAHEMENLYQEVFDMIRQKR